MIKSYTIPKLDEPSLTCHFKIHNKICSCQGSVWKKGHEKIISILNSKAFVIILKEFYLLKIFTGCCWIKVLSLFQKYDRWLSQIVLVSTEWRNGVRKFKVSSIIDKTDEARLFPSSWPKQKFELLCKIHAHSGGRTNFQAKISQETIQIKIWNHLNFSHWTNSKAQIKIKDCFKSEIKNLYFVNYFSWVPLREFSFKASKIFSALWLFWVLPIGNVFVDSAEMSNSSEISLSLRLLSPNLVSSNHFVNDLFVTSQSLRFIKINYFSKMKKKRDFSFWNQCNNAKISKRWMD